MTSKKINIKCNTEVKDGEEILYEVLEGYMLNEIVYFSTASIPTKENGTRVVEDTMLLSEFDEHGVYENEFVFMELEFQN